jgi:hypothetical protein
MAIRQTTKRKTATTKNEVSQSVKQDRLNLLFMKTRTAAQKVKGVNLKVYNKRPSENEYYTVSADTEFQTVVIDGVGVKQTLTEQYYITTRDENIKHGNMSNPSEIRGSLDNPAYIVIHEDNAPKGVSLYERENGEDVKVMIVESIGVVKMMWYKDGDDLEPVKMVLKEHFKEAYDPLAVPEGKVRNTVNLMMYHHFAEADVKQTVVPLLKTENEFDYKKQLDSKSSINIASKAKFEGTINGLPIRIKMTDTMGVTSSSLDDSLMSAGIDNTLKNLITKDQKKFMSDVMKDSPMDFLRYSMGDVMMLPFVSFNINQLGIDSLIDANIQYFPVGETLYDLKKDDDLEELRYGSVIKKSTGAFVESLYGATLNYHILTKIYTRKYLKTLTNSQKNTLVNDEIFKNNVYTAQTILTKVFNTRILNGNSTLMQHIGYEAISVSKTHGGIAKSLTPTLNTGVEIVELIKNLNKKKVVKGLQLAFDNDVAGAYAAAMINTNVVFGQRISIRTTQATDNELTAALKDIGVLRGVQFTDKVLKILLVNYKKNNYKGISLGLVINYILPLAPKNGFQLSINSRENEPLGFHNTVILSAPGMNYEGIQRTAKRDLLQSSEDVFAEKIESFKTKPVEMGELIVNSPDSVLLSDEIINGVFTTPLLVALRTNASKKDIKAVNNLLVTGIDLHVTPLNNHDEEGDSRDYVRSMLGSIVPELVEDIELERQLMAKDSNRKDRIWSIQKEVDHLKNVIRQSLPDNDKSDHLNRYLTGDIFGMLVTNLGDIIITEGAAKRSTYKKGTPMNTFYKLINNTLYGCLASVYFEATSNSMTANNITANIRMVVRMMSLANPTIQLITDGGVQLAVKMTGWDEKNRLTKTVSAFSDGVRVVDGEVKFVGLKLANDQINIQEIDYEKNTMTVDGVHYTGNGIKDFLSSYSQNCIMDMFGGYFKEIGTPSFEMKQIIDPEQLVFEGSTNNCFMGSNNANTVIKRRGSSFGKDRIVEVVDGRFKSVDKEPVRDMYLDIQRDGLITIQKPHIESGIMKLKRSCERGFQSSDVGDSTFKVISVKPQFAAIDLKREAYWKAFNNAKIDIADKCILGVCALGVDFDNKDELVVDINKMNALAVEITSVSNEDVHDFTKKEALKTMKVNYAKLAKHKPYLEYVKTYLEMIEEVDKLNKYERCEPRDKKLNKMIFKAVSEIK